VTRPLPRPYPPRRLLRLDSRVFGARPATPQCSSGVDAHARRHQSPIVVCLSVLVRPRPREKTARRRARLFRSRDPVPCSAAAGTMSVRIAFGTCKRAKSTTCKPSRHERRLNQSGRPRERIVQTAVARIYRLVKA